MDKVKVALTLLTIAIMVGPLAYVVVVNRDNLIGIVLPPQFGSLLNLQGLTGDTNTTDLMSNIQMPTPVGEPQYFPENQSYAFAFNFTNPLPEPIKVDSFSAAIYSTDGVFLGNVTLNSPLNIGANQSGIIDISGAWTDEALNYIKNNSNPDGTLNVNFQNINFAAGGMEIHLDQLPPNLIPSIPIPVGEIS